MQEVLFSSDLSQLDIERVLKRAFELSQKKEYQPKKLMQGRSAIDNIIDVLDAPVRKITKEKFTKLENVGLLLMTVGIMGSLLVYGLSKLTKKGLFDSSHDNLNN